MIAQDASGILIEVDDPQEDRVAYRYFVYYGIYSTTEQVGDGSAEILREKPFASKSDIDAASAIIPGLKLGQRAMIRNFQLLAVKINGTWRPA